MSALQHLLGYDEETGEHTRAYMLRRMVQRAVMGDRGITNVDVARASGLSREGVRQYFEGSSSPRSLPHGWQEPDAVYEARREAREDSVERAIEAISARRAIVMPLAENYIQHEVVIPELMKRPFA